jgi:hypothetical protein
MSHSSLLSWYHRSNVYTLKAHPVRAIYARQYANARMPSQIYSISPSTVDHPSLPPLPHNSTFQPPQIHQLLNRSTTPADDYTPRTAPIFVRRTLENTAPNSPDYDGGHTGDENEEADPEDPANDRASIPFALLAGEPGVAAEMSVYTTTSSSDG